MSGKAVEWDDANPWHAHFVVMLDCRCSGCGLLADTADLFDHYKTKGRRDYPNSLFRFCIKAGARLASEGWQIGANKLPYCPECWMKQQGEAEQRV